MKERPFDIESDINMINLRLKLRIGINSKLTNSKNDEFYTQFHDIEKEIKVFKKWRLSK